MARTDHYRGVKRFCVMCQSEIPADRKWDAVTCSPECTQARKQYGRSRKDQAACRYCLKPSTPEDRERYKAWSKWEKEHAGDEEFSTNLKLVNLTRENKSLKKRLAELEGREPEEHTNGAVETVATGEEA